MAIRLSKRSRSHRDPVARDATIQAEQAALSALAATLRRLAGELPGESHLAAEFTKVARSIDVAGALGAYGLHALAGEAAGQEEVPLAQAA
jgi:hypothetical protein